MEAFERQRRAVFVSSLILTAALVFDITGTTLSAGGLTVDFHSQGWLYAILGIAWIWEVYRYWVVESHERRVGRGRLEANVWLKADVRREFEEKIRPRVEEKILTKIDRQQQEIETCNLGEWTRHNDGWLTTWEYSTRPTLPSGRRTNGKEEMFVPSSSVPGILQRSRRNEYIRGLYLSEYIAPWVVAALPIPALVVRVSVWAMDRV